MSEYMIIKDRATIYQALAEQLCNRCAYDSVNLLGLFSGNRTT